MAEAPLAPVGEPAPEPTCVSGFLSFRERMARRKAEKEIICAVEENPSTPAAADAPVSGSEVPILPEVGEHSEMQSLGVPPQGSASAAPVASSRSRKRKCVALAEGGPSLPKGLRIAPVLRGKFISLIDGMIGDCSTEAARLARELGEAQGHIS
ncbi:Uncharacterized protein Rs2_04943 [Raphanus sativus]|nr:Uncharacterized protein Rs2_04943 [Raphanus sativus]